MRWLALGEQLPLSWKEDIFWSKACRQSVLFIECLVEFSPRRAMTCRHPESNAAGLAASGSLCLVAALSCHCSTLREPRGRTPHIVPSQEA